MNELIKFQIAAFCCLSLVSCGDEGRPGEIPLAPNPSPQNDRIFELVSPAESGVNFVNDIREDAYHNIFSYDYIYNGGGVAIGDLNNDSLPDLYFAGNRTANKCYLNLGGFRFRDITENAGLGGMEEWSSGVTITDVNQDGYRDIYVCRSFNREDPAARANLLYINNGDLTFTERAEEYGLADRGYSIHSAFFDYDLDGDLDMYLTNHPVNFKYETQQRLADAQSPSPEVSDRLYRNEGNGKFTDVSSKAGIVNYGYGLGLAVSDLSGDGWPDIYVANDYEESDFYYVNNRDGTFTESLKKHFDHISYFGMGSDAADINNDGHPDLMVLDMMAEDNYRQKTMMASMNIPRFWELIHAGRHYQFMRNTLQLSNGNGNFSEVAQLAGLAKTDWSWAALFADYNNDGLKDLFVTNGYRRDSRNVDASRALTKLLEENNGTLPRGKTMDMLNTYPSEKLPNYLFINEGNLHFAKKSFESGITVESFSNGAAWADLDNDGRLDLVVNNLLDPAFLYKNTGAKGNYLRIKLNGRKGNLSGIGSKIYLTAAGVVQMQELYTSRGYLSCVEDILHFGLGAAEKVDELRIVWPGGNEQVIHGLAVNQTISLDQEEAGPPARGAPEPETLFSDITGQSGIDFVHRENDYDDFKKETLLPHKMSQFGPGIAAADVNGDGYDDFFIGGAAGQAGALYFGQAGNHFRKGPSNPWLADKEHEDMGCAFFDADGDGDADLYVSSGGNEFETGSPLLQDRLYLNDSRGIFTLSQGRLPNTDASGSCVVPGDYDSDGDADLFVGGRVEVQKYPFPPQSYLLRNDRGSFSDVTGEAAASLQRTGMVTSAAWSDFDGDRDLDLFVAGEWMPLSLFRNTNGSFENITASAGLDKTAGWWNALAVADVDGDGDQDIFAGNYGLNSKYKARLEEPLHVYCHDFDNTGTLDIVLGYYNSGVCFPVRGRQCSSEQMPMLKEKFPTYHDYASATLEQVYGDGLKKALHYEAVTFASSLVMNNGDNKFTLKLLPVEAQVSSVFGIIPDDFDGDGFSDVLLAGNFYMLEIETGRNDGGRGLLLKGDGRGGFVSVPPVESGFLAPGDVKGMAMAGSTIIVARNNSAPLAFEYRARKMLN